jgi:hypothetical protein
MTNESGRKRYQSTTLTSIPNYYLDNLNRLKHLNVSDVHIQ